ncbi:MAG: hypothetical protein BAJALOKI2v1_290012 [Promethearchaeota archaeon]|nr:MAG: hypothetical protein BAJALOKI2v1_290012 [Candidatus Lokiarchaeota archaeon]
MARCPECAGKMKFNSMTKSMVCTSCGLSLTRNELDSYWKKIKTENYQDMDESEKKKKRRQDWLQWHAKSKEERERY